ncbi:MAG: bifunctional oligoribonuclease/PAP phosphatase NrnA [Actinobacteria bacterium]|nr:bifunctional oligoribonuclease/PAP phosphatase NrnA [Actinomycetota bacterium]
MKAVQEIQNKAEEFLKIVQDAKTVGIAGHINPDGDCLGAMLALYDCLKGLGKDVDVYASSKDLPENYYFLPGTDEIKNSDDGKKHDIFIAIDCPNLKRLGIYREIFLRAKYTVNIDHHADNENFANLNFVSTDISSSSEIVFWILKSCGFEISYNAALCLYTGIVTDTGRFQYSNTYPSTFEAAQQLVLLGVKPVEVFRKVYENIKPEVLKLLGLVLERVENKNGFYWSYIDAKDFSDYNVRPSETENFIDYIRAIKGVEVAALFKSFDEEINSWKVSLRSRGSLNVQKLCARFGGGGHPEASGCEVTGNLSEAVRKILEEYEKMKNLEADE